MEVIRQIVDLNKLESVINIPKGFNHTKVEVIIFPADDFIPKEKKETLDYMRERAASRCIVTLP